MAPALHRPSPARLEHPLHVRPEGAHGTARLSPSFTHCNSNAVLVRIQTHEELDTLVHGSSPYGLRLGKPDACGSAHSGAQSTVLETSLPSPSERPCLAMCAWPCDATLAATAEQREGAQIESHQGHVVDMAGDSVLAMFDTAIGAVTAALKIQNTLNASVGQTPDDHQMRFRIGVHLGDVIEKADGTIYCRVAQCNRKRSIDHVPCTQMTFGASDRGVVRCLSAAGGARESWSLPHLRFNR